MPALDAVRDLPPHLREPIFGCARGDLPPNIAVMQLSASVDSARAVTALLSQALDAFDAAGRTGEAARLRTAQALWSNSPNAWATIRMVLDQIGADPKEGPVGNGTAAWSGVFDRLARVAPEAGVALYALGRADLFDAATGEVADRMRVWRVLGRDRTMLDIGCGIGRFLPNLCREARFIVGLEISRGMLEAARARCRGIDNVALVQGGGKNLAAFRDQAFDLVYAIDSFPYIVDAGADIAASHFVEAHRVLKPGGVFLIVNYSYRGRVDLDRADVERLSASSGFAVVESGGGGLRHWDGRIFRLSKPRAVRTNQEV